MPTRRSSPAPTPDRVTPSTSRRSGPPGPALPTARPLTRSAGCSTRALLPAARDEVAVGAERYAVVARPEGELLAVLAWTTRRRGAGWPAATSFAHDHPGRRPRCGTTPQPPSHPRAGESHRHRGALPGALRGLPGCFGAPRAAPRASPHRRQPFLQFGEGSSGAAATRRPTSTRWDAPVRRVRPARRVRHVETQWATAEQDHVGQCVLRTAPGQPPHRPGDGARITRHVGAFANERAVAGSTRTRHTTDRRDDQAARRPGPTPGAGGRHPALVPPVRAGGGGRRSSRAGNPAPAQAHLFSVACTVRGWATQKAWLAAPCRRSRKIRLTSAREALLDHSPASTTTRWPSGRSSNCWGPLRQASAHDPLRGHPPPRRRHRTGCQRAAPRGGAQSLTWRRAPRPSGCRSIASGINRRKPSAAGDPESRPSRQSEPWPGWRDLHAAGAAAPAAADGERAAATWAHKALDAFPAPADARDLLRSSISRAGQPERAIERLPRSRPVVRPEKVLEGTGPAMDRPNSSGIDGEGIAGASDRIRGRLRLARPTRASFVCISSIIPGG